MNVRAVPLNGQRKQVDFQINEKRTFRDFLIREIVSKVQTILKEIVIKVMFSRTLTGIVSPKAYYDIGHRV